MRSTVALLAALLALAACSVADAASSTISLKGPTANNANVAFTYTISGNTGQADFLVYYEQFNKLSGCSSTWAGEEARALFDNNSYEITQPVTAPEHTNAKLSTAVSLFSRNPGVHGLCAYLISLANGNTYADASAWWTNK